MKKLLLLFGYLTGVAVAAKVLKPKKEAPAESYTREAVQNIADVHRGAFDQVKGVVWTDENKAFLNEKKDEATNFVNTFKKDALAKIEELKEQGIDLLEGGEDEIKALYDHRQDYLAKAKEWGVDTLHDASDALEKAYNDVKSNLTKK